jgi:hypothetical protein
MCQKLLLGISKVIGPEINVEKTKYMFMSRHQTTGQNQIVKTVNKSFENMANFRYLKNIRSEN